MTNKKTLPNIIKCERIVLKKHTLELASVMFDAVNNDRARLREFLPWVDSTKTTEDEINYIQMTHEKWDKLELFDYGMFSLNTNNFIGNIGLHSIFWNHARAEIGYWILEEFEGQGFVTEAVQSLVRVCFEVGFNRIEIRCSSNNQRSANVPKRLGFEHEATLKKNRFENNTFVDTLIFTKFKI